MRAVCSFCFGNTMRAYLIVTLYSAICYLQVYYLIHCVFVQQAAVELYSYHCISQNSSISNSTHVIKHY